MNYPSFIRLFFPVFLIFFNFLQIKAQYYERTYGDNNKTSGIYFAKTHDNGLVIIGNTVDSLNRNGYYILKTDSGGSIVWEKSFIDIFDAYSYSIVTLSDGKIVLLGTHTRALFPIVAEVMVLDSDGSFIQSEVFPPFDGWGTAGVGLAIASDTTIALTLYNDGFISNNYYSIFSLNTDLSIRWSDFISFDGSFTTAHGIAAAPGKQIYTSSYYDDYFFDIVPLFRVTHIRKYDYAGGLKLDSLYEFNCPTSAISVTNDGGAIICGTQDTSFQNDLVLIRIDSSGNLLWQKQYGSNFNEVANAVIESSDGGFVLLATIQDSVIPGQNDLLLFKTNANGDSLWSRKFGGALNEIGLHIEEHNSDLIILGSTTSFNDDRIYVVKTDSAGIIESPFNIISNGRYFCQNDTALLQVTPTPGIGLQISWSNGDTINPIKVTESGNYFATLTDSNGFSLQTPTIPVYFSNPPLAFFGTDTMSLCSETILVNAADSELTNIYQWYFNDSLLPDEIYPMITPEVIGTYKLIVANNCASDTAISFIDSLYQLPIQPIISSLPFDFVCPGDSLQLHFNPEAGTTYQWYTTDFNLTYIIPGQTDTLYYVKDVGVFLVRATNIFGCVVSSLTYEVPFDYDQVFVDPSGPAFFCKGGEVELSVPLGTNFNWSRGDTTQTITVNVTGDYFVSFINANGCLKNSDTIAINIFDNPIIDLGIDTNLCSGATITLDGGAGFNNYFWNDGSVDQTLIAYTVGPFPDTTEYFVSVTDTNGCTGADTVRVVFDICPGINEISSDFLTIYPNPVSSGSFLNILNNTGRSFSLIIKDLLGREIFQEHIHLSNSKINYRMIPGVYYYYFQDEGKIKSSGLLIIN